IIREKLSDKAPDAFVLAQEDAKQEIGEVQGQIAQVTLQLEGPGADRAVLLVDGRELPSALLGVRSSFNPGEHVLSVTGDGVAAEPQTIQVEPGASASFSLHV